MKLIIKGNNGIEVKFENECFTISIGENLVETRDRFLYYMGCMFDEAVYAALGQEKTEEGKEDMFYLSNTIALNQELGVQEDNIRKLLEELEELDIEL